MQNAVMFTAIPTGIVRVEGGKTIASLSVYVTPQVQNKSLASYAAFADWPQTVRDLAFRAQFASGGVSLTLDPNPKYATNRLDSQLWKKIFGPAQVNGWKVKDYSSAGLL